MKEATNSFASLSPSLLARKGGARPAMRPQLAPLTEMPSAVPMASNLDDLGWNDMGEDDYPQQAEPLHLTPAPANAAAEDEAEALDLAEEAKLADNAEEKRAEVLRQREELKARLSATPAPTPATDLAPAPEPVAEPVAKPVTAKGIRSPKKKLAENTAAKAGGKRAAFTLRLDAERHLKLRLASTIQGASAQQIVTDALDSFLARTPELAALAAQVHKR